MNMDGHPTTFRLKLGSAIIVLCVLLYFISQSFERDLLASTKEQVLFKTSPDCDNDDSTSKWPPWPPSSNISKVPPSINSLPDTTGPGVPQVVKNWLLEDNVEIDENAQNSYGALAAVKAKESKCGWDPSSSNFNDAECTEAMGFTGKKMNPSELTLNPSLVDIVTPSIRDLDFLNKWREFFQGFHVIIVQDGDPDKFLKVPDWVDYELYNRRDIEKTLGSDSWIISDRDASIRNFGFLVSRKRFIYTIDDDCLPALDNDGYKINPLAIHVRNLQTPSTPFFFNTLYDPYAPGSDFVRGYPYSLRGGVLTAVSHGLWLNAPDYDAPTQLLKVTERNTRLVDTTVTVPHGTLYPMCSMNVAFAREEIGPALMQGLMGTGQPWARYDDMFAGWASKVVADHLSFGVKSGQPYIRHDKASNPFTNLYKEYKGLWWQEDVIRFMSNVRLPSTATTAATAYKALASEIRKGLTHLHEYFGRLALAMERWVHVWEKSENGTIEFHPSRSYQSPAQPINLGERGRSRIVRTNLTSLFGRLANPPANVTEQDRQLGSSWKTYVYPLDPKFHVEVFEAFDKGCLLSPCNEEDLNKAYEQSGDKQYIDYVAEIVILSKLLSSLKIVDDPDEADLFLVPALPVTVSMTSCRNFGGCKDSWYKELFQQLVFLEDATKPHLFLATQDWNQNHPSIANDLHQRKNAVVANLGPGGIVVPSLNTAMHIQHSMFKQARAEATADEDKVFILGNFGIRYDDRKAVANQLQNYNGTRRIVKPGEAWSQDDMFASTFTLCLPGDLPSQKRFFDAILHLSIPVVVERQAALEGTKESFRTFWIENTKHYSSNIANYSVAASYPDISFSGILYDDFMVSLSEEEVHSDIVGALKRIYSDKEGMARRKEALKKARELFLYNFEGNAPDAFTAFMRNLRSIVLPDSQ